MPTSIRITHQQALDLLRRESTAGSGQSFDNFQALQAAQPDRPSVLDCDVFIAGSGLTGCTYAREILDKCDKNALRRVYMADIGAHESPVVGAHLKNAAKYQKDLDSFTRVIEGALQPVSVASSNIHQSTLGGNSWRPDLHPRHQLAIQGQNPQQARETNLAGSAITRAVGGMATHWTCSCATPHADETSESPVKRQELDSLLQRANALLKVDSTVFDKSIRNTVVKKILTDSLAKRNPQNIPLAVQRHEKDQFVTWSGSNTILGDTVKDSRLSLAPEQRVTRLVVDPQFPGVVLGVVVRDLRTDHDFLVRAKAYIMACGAVCTPQILHNSNIRLPALGHYLSEQSVAFCQIVLNRGIIDSIANTNNSAWRELIDRHRKAHPSDPLPIPFRDLEPQLMIPYSRDFPWHAQIHRDAFSYGEVGTRSDPRVVVDLRFFGKSDVVKNNRVEFCNVDAQNRAEQTDLYGMPQATFNVERTKADAERDQKMMNDMTSIANTLGGWLPGSEPRFMEPGLALHITGTTRIGTNKETSVADASSQVWGFENLWVGGRGVIPDSTASNPTSTSLAYALKSAAAVVEHLKKRN